MKYLILLSVLIISSCAISSSNTDRNGHRTQATPNMAVNNDYNLLLASLLNEVDKTQFLYTDQLGNSQYDELKHFKALEKIYVKNTTKNLDDGKLNQQQLKNIMFFSFYASEKNSAAYLEYLAADLMGIYQSHSSKFIDTLSELPFLIESNCNRLNAFFGFEGENAKLKPQFVKTNRELFSHVLSADQLETCFEEFR